MQDDFPQRSMTSTGREGCGEEEPDAWGNTGEREECMACDGRGVEYGETCLTCGGYGWVCWPAIGEA